MSVWQNKTVLITGASGWLGRHLVERLHTMGVRSIRVYSRDEHKHHAMRQIWPDLGEGALCSYFVGDVRDASALHRATEGADYIIHAAALKRVEGSATHAREILKTNVLGTANVVDAAITNGVKRTVFISSDKAAGGVSCYGKSKALAEDLVIEGNAHAGARDIRFASCRYGNIALSTGSVLHLWKAAVEAGKPIPITGYDFTRFWFTVDKAVSFVLDTIEHMAGGEIFVPDMPRIRLFDLAMAAFPGQQHHILGERPGGEKLAETCIGEDEARHTCVTPWGAYCIYPQSPIWDANYVAPGLNVLPGFSLRSDQGPFATVDELRGLLSEAGWE